MQIFELLDSLEGELKELFKGFKFESKSRIDLPVPEHSEINVKQGWYVEKPKENEFPYVLISPVKNTASWDEDKIEIMLIFGTHSFNKAGWKDPALMANYVKRYLNENYVIGKKFPIIKNADGSSNITIDFPDQQPYPQWFCFMTLRFNAYNAQVNPIWKGGVYGEDNNY